MEQKSNIILVSDFGRSGQGWLSYMICYILNARFIEPYDFLNGKIYSSSKEVVSLTSGNLPGREKTKFNLVVKTHNYPSADFNLTDKVIFLIRDPRDVAVSMHNLHLIQERKVGRINPRAKSFLLLWKYCKIFDYIKIMSAWQKHYSCWHKVSCHQVRYEDLLNTPQETLKGILNYLKTPIDDKVINEAISLFSFEKITGRKRGEEDRQNPEFRKGISGDYKNKFSKFDLWLMNTKFKSIIKKSGYEIDH
ncbi:MAG: sulfotransferase domain-containing protein [Candidatus Staskawiczbacteria bacterium]|nr:sulfotransferase domain-containing protein [Candidatus Staskawiczbacteria bacterium]